MFKCMSLLVASMSAGAVLLSLGEPGPAQAAAAAVQRAALTSIEWVNADAALRPEVWQIIQVRHERPTAGQNGKLLTAVSRQEIDHFVIRPDGALTISPAWQSQRSRGAADGAIRIRVERSRPEMAASPAQQEVLDGLLRVLQSRCGIAAQGVISGGTSDHLASPPARPANS